MPSNSKKRRREEAAAAGVEGSGGSGRRQHHPEPSNPNAKRKAALLVEHTIVFGQAGTPEASLSAMPYPKLRPASASLGPVSRLGRGHTPALSSTQVALLLAYSGTRYQGLQKNPGAVTVEEALEAAIHRAGGIADDNVGTLQKVSWSRAGRTDKGVHAVG